MVVRRLKLRLEDIVIIGQGQQIKKRLIIKFGSIDEFIKASNIAISKETINNYLRRSIVKSDKFKFKLVSTFEMSFSEIVKTPEQQIKEFTDQVYINITDYRDEEDITVLEKIKEMCETYHLGLELAKMYLVIGMHHRILGNIGNAYGHFEIAEFELQSRNAHQLLITLYAEQLIIYFQAKEYLKAEQLYHKIELKIYDCVDLDDRALFNYLYNIGLLYNNNQKHQFAENFFTKALKYARPGLEYGSALMNIGLSLKRRGEFYKAIEYYKQTVIEFENVENKKKSIIYNNLAEVYRMQRDYDMALKNLNRAFELIGNVVDNNSFMMHLTYVQILHDLKRNNVAMNEINILIDTIRLNKKYKLQNKYISECLKYLCNFAISAKNIELLTKLSNVIAYLIRQDYNYEYTGELKALYADIHLSLE
jgi:tetratricopeptide (TPR) repeat protein